MIAATEILPVLLVGGGEETTALLKSAAPRYPALRIECLPADIEPSHASIASAGVIVLYRVRWPSGNLREANRCRAVIHLGEGAGCDLEEARERGIFVCSLPGVAAEEVAQKLDPVLQEFLVTGNPASTSPGGREFRRPRLGLVGLGRLGRAIARVARERKFDLWAYDPFALEEDFIQADARPVPRLEDALGIPDLVFVQVAPAEANRRMIATEEVAMLRKGAWLINAGWGPAVDASAAREAMQRGRLAHWIPDTPSGGASLSEQLEFSQERPSESALDAALDLASRIARGEDPTPLLIDPPCPRWEP